MRILGLGIGSILLSVEYGDRSKSVIGSKVWVAPTPQGVHLPITAIHADSIRQSTLRTITPHPCHHPNP